MAKITIHLGVEGEYLAAEMSFESDDSDSPKLQKAAATLARRLAEDVLPNEITAAFGTAEPTINSVSEEYDSATKH